MTPLSIDHLKQQGVYFHSTGAYFQSVTVNMGAGLNALGIPIFSNIDFELPLVSDFKFEAAKGKFVPALTIIDLLEGSFKTSHPFHISADTGNIHVLAMCDTIDLLNYEGSIPVHRAHCNRLMSTPYRSIPIGFGVSEKLREYSDAFDHQTRRENVVLRNFRTSANQFLRLALDLSLVPKLEERIPIDRRMTQARGRWDTSYYDRLGSSLACLCYGGSFKDDDSEYWANVLDPADPGYAFLTRNCVYQSPAIIRWDSWRFWEAMTMGCVAIQLDFEKYGFELPVMPENWVHYVGISMDNFAEDVERMMDEPELLAQISENGRKWAIEHYTPIPVAKRFLKSAGVEIL